MGHTCENGYEPSRFLDRYEILEPLRNEPETDERVGETLTKEISKGKE